MHKPYEMEHLQALATLSFDRCSCESRSTCLVIVSAKNVYACMQQSPVILLPSFAMYYVFLQTPIVCMMDRSVGVAAFHMVVHHGPPLKCTQWLGKAA